MRHNLDDIRRLVGLHTYTFDIESVKYTIEAVESQDALLDCVEGDAEPPYGLLLWESALALAHTLSLHDEPWMGKDVLELGCGTGLPGLVCARLGAGVVQTDMLSIYIRLAQHNGGLNDRPNIRYHISNWEQWNTPGTFDVIIGADLFYDRRVHRDLATVISRSLKPGGTVILADPQRISTPGFLDIMNVGGWQVSTTVVKVHALHDSPPNPLLREIDIHRLFKHHVV